MENVLNINRPLPLYGGRGLLFGGAYERSEDRVRPDAGH